MLRELLASGRDVDAVHDATSIGSRFAHQPRKTLETICTIFTLSDPRKRWITNPNRRASFGFAVANTIWTLGGGNDVEAIAFYSNRAREFSNEGGILLGSVGHRIIYGGGGNQIEAVIDRLRVDGTSRRAVLQIFCAEDSVSPVKDTPCSLSIQFLLRDGRLKAITFMRSQSAVMVLPYDIFMFTMLQEVVATAVGAELGDYIHVCGSFHVYEDEMDALYAIVDGATATDGEVPMPRMATPCFRPGSLSTLKKMCGSS